MASSPRVFPVVATVPTGLERGAAEECREVLGKCATVQRGSITCTLDSVEELAKFDGLRSIDNYHTVVGILPDFCREESTVLERLESLPSDRLLDWTAALQLWKFYSDHIQPSALWGGEDTRQMCNAKSSKVENGSDSGTGTDSGENKTNSNLFSSDLAPSEAAGDDNGARHYQMLLDGRDISFRATCTRGGRKHKFTSPEAAKHFGAGLARYFGWKVQLKQPDIEVLLDITGDSATVGVALTREAKFKRNITHFGPTTLRATIAYGMLRCADIQLGDIVLDPLCGGGTISIEGSLAWPETYHVAGDVHDLAVTRIADNLSSLLQEAEHRRGVDCMKCDVCQWDVCMLPLRTASVDVVVTDMPFGKKSGSRIANWVLYPKALDEMARVCRPESARAVLLTHDNKALSKSVQRNIFWKRIKTLWVNVGGLETALYILQRSSLAYRQNS